MPILRTDFPTLTDDLQEIFNEVAKTKVAEMIGPRLFEVRDTNRRTFDHLILHGVSGIAEVTPGQDLPSVNSDEGDSATYTQRYFGAKFSVTKEMRKFDLHDQIEGLARSLTIDAFDKIDQSYADDLLYGWASSYTDVYSKSVSGNGPDGETLFNSAHSNGVSTSSRTYSNLINDGTNNNCAFSRNAVVKTRANALVYKDPSGIVRPINLDTLLVAPTLEDLAERTIYSGQISGNNNNDINPLKGKVKNIVVWPRLETRSDATSTSNYFFLADSTKVGESLKSKFAERPELDAPEEVYANKNWDYTCDFFYTIGRGFPAYIFGSNASA